MGPNEQALRDFRRGREAAPTGTYEDAKELGQVIGNTMHDLMRKLRALGPNANNSDEAFRLEAAIYAYVRASNPDSTLFPAAEGFGSSMGTEARERVIAQAASNRDFLLALGGGAMEGR